MVRPIGRPMARKAITLEDLREEFLAHCEALNLSGRTLEWYGDRTRRFAKLVHGSGDHGPLGPRLLRPRAVRAAVPSPGLRPTQSTATPS